LRGFANDQCGLLETAALAGVAGKIAIRDSEALLKYLASPEGAPVLRDCGLEP
jgi:hypothetical protein